MQTSSKRKKRKKRTPRTAAKAPAPAADYTKMDPALGALVREDEKKEKARDAAPGLLSVFIRLDWDKEPMPASTLERMGIEAPLSGTHGPITATLPPQKIRELSTEPSVSYIRLARQLKPIGGDEPG